MLSAHDALALSARLLGLSVALQAAELLAVRSAFRDDGSFPWSVVRRDFAERGALLRLLDGVLAYRPFVALLVVQFGCACALAFRQDPGLLLTLWLTLLLVAMRFRGSYNGGSDAMTLVVASALCIAACGGESVARAALAYVAAQFVLSYFAAGLAKLRSARWRRGSALADLVELRPYYVPPRLRGLLKRPTVAWLAGHVVLAFELSAPLALFMGVRITLLWLALSVGFHLCIAALLGLNRFVWAWLAAYPAVLFWSLALHP